MRSRVVVVLLTALMVTACDQPESLTAPLERTNVRGANTEASCDEESCVAVQAAFNSHFADPWCSGIVEMFYLPNEAHTGGLRASWDGAGLSGTTVRTLTARSYRESNGVCYNYSSPVTTSQIVYIYRYRPPLPNCGETYCDELGGSHYSHFEHPGCTGQESFFLPNTQHLNGRPGSWNGQGVAGVTVRALMVRSY